MAWGPGDAAAAIVGKNVGRHKLSGPHIEGVKSVEGTVAMGLTSFVCTLVTLLFMSTMGMGTAVMISGLVAVVSAFTELYTKNGLESVLINEINVSLLRSFRMI